MGCLYDIINNKDAKNFSVVKYIGKQRKVVTNTESYILALQYLQNSPESLTADKMTIEAYNGISNVTECTV